MKRLKGGKMTFPGLSLAIATAVFVLQVGTASPGAPGVCEEPCNEESGAAQLPVVPGAGIDLPVQAQEVESGLPESVDAEVEQASAPVPAEFLLLPTHTQVPAPRGGISVARGALGYRVPLVVKRRVPDQIRGGVYVLAHETYMVLQPGHWELEGAGEDPAAEAAASETMEAPEAAKGGWLRRLFGKRGRGCNAGS